MSREGRVNAICLMGPTGTGKSALALSLAKLYPLEIVSVDSVQVYKDLNIGNAKPSPIEQGKIAHHLINLCDLEESYSAARFCTDAKRVSAEILARGKLPLFVGGTGLYFRALFYGLSELPKSDADLRSQLQADLKAKGLSNLYSLLRRLDAKSATRIHPKDTQRVIRALEVCILSGRPMSSFFEKPPQSQDVFQPLKFVLFSADRNFLRECLRIRFMNMLDSGLINEVLSLKSSKKIFEAPPACLRSVGYNDVWRYLDEQLEYNEMVSRAVVATYRLAKRQNTWFRGEREAMRLESSDKKLLLEKIRQEIEKAKNF